MEELIIRRLINNIARYIIGVWGLVLLFLLACVFNEENVVADKLIIFASVIFVGVTIILFVTYFILNYSRNNSISS